MKITKVDKYFTSKLEFLNDPETFEGFPKISDRNVKILDPNRLRGDGWFTPPDVYNCIGWALGEFDWISPGEFDYNVLKNILKASLKAGEKIAIYRHSREQRVSHAARYTKFNGKWCWTSKIGGNYLIQHTTPKVLEGPSYGKVTEIIEGDYEQENS